jgi:hypothetical protein
MTAASDPGQKQWLPPRWVDRLFSVPLILGGLILFLYGPGLFILQVTVWLQDGRWIQLPGIYLFEPPIVPDSPEDIAFYVANGLPVQPALKVKLTDRTEILAEIHALRTVNRFLPSLGPTPRLSEPISWRGVHKIVHFFLKIVHFFLDVLSVPVLSFCSGLVLLLGVRVTQDEIRFEHHKRRKGP